MSVVQNLNKRYKLNERFIKKIISNILKVLKKPQGTELEVIFLDDRAIKDINKRYRRKDAPTDVLSFRIDRAEFGSREFLGEIFISLDRAHANSKIFKTAFENEVTLYVIHGILHLFGGRDEGRVEKIRMSKKESKILNYLCKKEDLSKVLTPR